MTESLNDEAIIIKRGDWRENDSRVVLYSRRHGKQSLVARGAKRPGSKLAGHIEPLALADILVLKGKNQDYLASAVSRTVYLQLKNDLNALYFAGRAAAVFNRLIKEEAGDPEIFDFLCSWLETLDNRAPVAKEEGTKIYDYFLIRLLSLLGYRPELYQCAQCRQPLTPQGNRFVFRLGGAVCPTCFAEAKDHYLPTDWCALSGDCLKILRIFSESDTYQAIVWPAGLGREIDRLARLLVDFV